MARNALPTEDFKSHKRDCRVATSLSVVAPGTFHQTLVEAADLI